MYFKRFIMRFHSKKSYKMAKFKLNDENLTSEDLLPPNAQDRSGVGVNYADEYIKKINTRLEDGTFVKCKRRGLRITMMVGQAKGEALINRIEHGPDPKVMLNHALTSATKATGWNFIIEDGAMYIEQ